MRTATTENLHSAPAATRSDELTPLDLRMQAEFRYHLRRFLKISEINARDLGLESNQFQLLLAVKGQSAEASPSITDLSRRLLVGTNSVVEMVDRLEEKGMIERFQQGKDKRKVFVRLTARAEALVEEIAVRNLDEIRSAAPAFLQFLNTLR